MCSRLDYHLYIRVPVNVLDYLLSIQLTAIKSEKAADHGPRFWSLLSIYTGDRNGARGSQLCPCQWFSREVDNRTDDLPTVYHYVSLNVSPSHSITLPFKQNFYLKRAIGTKSNHERLLACCSLHKLELIWWNWSKGN